MQFKYEDYMNQIHESRSGMRYVDTILKIKKTLTTKAVLTEIRHDHEANNGICLKIGRYKSDGTPAVSNPKSELTLDQSEFEELIAFIEKYLGPLKAGVDSFIPVNEQQMSQTLRKFKDFAMNNSEKAKMLLESGVFNEEISVILENSKKVASLKEFKTNIDQDYDEHFWQEWFGKNKWVLGSEFIRIINERDIDPNNIADYLVQSNDGFLDVVEIKKPNGMNFWAANKDHDNYVPSTELIKAITQCQNYIYAIERKTDSKEFAERVEDTPVARPTCLLVFGRSNDWDDEKRVAFRLLNSSLNRVAVITYDHLLKRAVNIMGPQSVKGE